MNVDELKRNLRNVIERYRNKEEFTGEVCRDVMARDCLHVVEELEAENARLKQANIDCNSHFNTLKEDYDELKTELEEMRQTKNAYKTKYIALQNENKELKRTKRALWLARAERAKEKASFFESLCASHYKRVVNIYGIVEEPPFRFYKNRLRFSEDWVSIFLAVERKCRAYADKFKEE